MVVCFALLASTAVSADDPLKSSTSGIKFERMGVTATSTVGAVILVDPSSISCPDCSDLNTVRPENHDEIVSTGGIDIAERFNGQTLTYLGTFDVLSGSPSSPLSLQVGLPSQNIDILPYSVGPTVAGLGPLGYPAYDAIGEGSVAVLYPSSQASLKFDVTGSEGGPMTVKFFKSDGSLLDTIVIGAVTDKTYAFKTSSGDYLISGISIENTDPAGIGYYNICYLKTIEGPEFPSLFFPSMMIIGILGAVFLIQRTREY